MSMKCAIRTWLYRPDYPIIWTGESYDEIFARMRFHNIKIEDENRLERGWFTDGGKFLPDTPDWPAGA
jgi:hypothetical protein